MIFFIQQKNNLARKQFLKYCFLVIGALVSLSSVLFLLPVKQVNAEKEHPFSLTPLIIDEKASRRDIVRRTITITNNAERRLNIYATVNNVDPVKGSQNFAGAGDADLSRSLANWIEITRGAIDLLPGESRDVSVLVQINLRAEPGTYHAFISFGEGATRVEAESRKDRIQSIAVNLDVLDDATEHLNLDFFSPDKNIFSGKNAEFKFALENSGNRSVTPKGEVRIYDRRGVEKEAISVNTDERTLSPENRKELSVLWQGASFGRYKALLDLEYGVGGKTIQDTVFFWVIPWQALGGVFATLAIIFITLIIVLYPRYERRFQGQIALIHGESGYSAHQEYIPPPPQEFVAREQGQIVESLPPPIPPKRLREKHRTHSHTVTLTKKLPPESHIIRLGKRKGC